MDGIDLTFTQGALSFIVDKALEYKLGARGLRSLCEAVLNDAMFELYKSETNTLKVTKRMPNKAFKCRFISIKGSF